MKKYFLLLAVTLFAVSCKKESEVEQKVAAVAVKDVKIERFDKLFFESGPEDLPQLKQQFPFFFPAGDPDQVWIARMKEPFLRQLYTEVQKQYPNVNGLESDFEDLFRHIKFYYPKFTDPRVITMVNDDETTKAIFADQLVIIPLSVYLGKGNKIYEGLPKYQVQGFERSQILPDVVTSFSNGKIKPVTDRTLLSMMIYYGKELYIKDLLLPGTPDHEKIAYTPQQLEWCKANEEYMWRYFIEENILYDTDSKLGPRFINPAPFSKFYLEVDNESPGRTGQWIGWQIVRSYMENNKNVTLQELLAKDAKEIFDKSKYKPKK
jgi:gliding motility-associated lipoprotein GldB